MSTLHRNRNCARRPHPALLAATFACSAIVALSGAAAQSGHNRVASAAPAPPSEPAARRGAPCPGTLVEVTATASEEVRLACEAASLALELLAPCRLALQRPLQLVIGNEPQHPFGQAVLGFFDTERGRVYITKYENMAPRLEGSPMAALPGAEVFRSVVVHEIAHAVMHQNARSQPPSYVAGEYLAYALQIESLPARDRTKLLGSVVRWSMDGLVFSGVMLQLDAFRFAAQAYDHLQASPDRCGRLRSLMAGEADFIQSAGF